VAVALWLGIWLPMPLVDTEGLASLAGGPWRLDAVARGALSLGPTPFLVGLVLVELAALIRPRWRARRRDDLAFRHRLTQVGLGLGLAWSLARGYLTAWQLEQLTWTLRFHNPSAPDLVADPGQLFRLGTALVLTAGACVWALGAWLVDRFGLGRGFAVVLLVDLLSGLPWGVWGAQRAVRQELLAPLALAALVAALGGLLWAFGRLWRQGERLGAGLPARLPTCGTLPLEVALVLALAPSVLATFFEGDWLTRFSQLVAPGSGTYLASIAGLVALLAVPASAWFHWRHRRAWRQGAQRRAWLRARAWSSAFLVGLALCDLAVQRGLGLAAELFWPGALGLLVVWALGADWWEELRALARAGAPGLQPVAMFQDVTDALRARAAAGADAVLTGLRYRSLAFFFAPFAPLILWVRRGPAGGGEPSAPASSAPDGAV